MVFRASPYTDATFLMNTFVVLWRLDQKPFKFSQNLYPPSDMGYLREPETSFQLSFYFNLDMFLANVCLTLNLVEHWISRHVTTSKLLHMYTLALGSHQIYKSAPNTTRSRWYIYISTWFYEFDWNSAVCRFYKKGNAKTNKTEVCIPHESKQKSTSVCTWTAG